MDFAKILSTYEDPILGLAVLEAVSMLFSKDHQLLSLDASEQAVAAKIAQYLQPHFLEMDVDVEYNRMGEVPKKVAWSKKPAEVFPDIIVHNRDTTNNFLVIELKKDSNRETKHKDILKLGAYRTELGYKHALFMRFGVKDCAGLISECEWILP